MNDVIFGQYYPAESFMHKMDPRIKITVLIAYIVLIFLIKNFWGFLIVGAFLALAVIFSHVRVSSLLRSMKGVLFLIIFTAIINLFFYGSGEVVTVFGIRLEWWQIKITDKALVFTAFMALRLCFLVVGSSLLTLTTTPVALTDGIESLLYPLKLIRFPVHELALIMSIALRFIPTLMEETNRIISAQKARGADFEGKSLIRRAKALIPVLIPLLVSSFRRADELGDAMDSRCYSGAKGRTKYKKLTLGWRDAVGVIVFALFFVGAILARVYLGWSL